MTEDKEKDQSVEDSQTDAEPKSHIDAQREEAVDSQQESQEDSDLQTSQPDQRMPTEAERSAQEPPQATQVAATPSDQTVETEDGPKDAPEGYEPQVPLQPGQTGGVVERSGEQVSDVEAAENDQDESAADQDDDSAVDDPDSPEVSQEVDNPGESG